MSNSQKTSTPQSWGDSLGGVFKVTNFIHRYRLFSPFLYFPTSILNAIGSILAPLVLKSRTFKKQVLGGIDALYGSIITPKQKIKLFEANRRYLIQMYLDALFHSPNIYFHTVDRFIKFENIHYLDQVLAQGKGAILTTLHSGMYFHSMAGLVYHPKKYSVLTVVQPKNMIMYGSIITRPELRHFKVIPSLDYQKVRKTMNEHLKNNGIILIMFDYSKPNQFRVPAHLEKNPFLITTPQSPIRLLELNGTPIIPTLIIPDGEVGKSIIRFHTPITPPSPNLKITAKNSKKFHGDLSIKLNRFFFNYLKKYAPFWEELRKLEIRRKISIDFIDPLNISNFIDKIESNIIALLENSYEPTRNDMKLQEIIKKGFDTFKSSLNTDQSEIIIKPFSIEVIQNSGTDEIIFIIESCIEQIQNLNLKLPIQTLRNIITEIKVEKI